MITIDINVKNNRGQTPLLYAIYFKDEKIVKLLLENKADPNVNNNSEDIPLFCAVIFDEEKIKHYMTMGTE